MQNNSDLEYQIPRGGNKQEENAHSVADTSRLSKCTTETARVACVLVQQVSTNDDAYNLTDGVVSEVD